MGDSVKAAKENICLNSEGKGRFIFQGQKHIFSFQSHFEEKEKSWETLIDFPVYGRESIKIQWDETKDQAVYDASYEEALLKNSENLDPRLVEAATKLWVEFFEDILISRGELKEDSGPKIVWSLEDKSLQGKLAANNVPAKIAFLNPVPGKDYFGRFDFQLLSDKNKREFGMELIVRDCLENRP